MAKEKIKKGIVRVKLPKGLSLQDEVLVEKLLDTLKSRFTSVRYEKGYLRIEYYVHDYMKKDVEASIRRVLKEFYDSRETMERVLHRFNAGDIARMGGRTLPIDVIIFVLLYRGYTAKRVKGGLETSAPHKTVLGILSNLSSIADLIDGIEIETSRNLRNLLLLMKYLEPEKEISLLVEKLRSEGYLLYRNNSLDVSTSWKKVICKLYLTSSIGSKIMQVCSEWRK